MMKNKSGKCACCLASKYEGFHKVADTSTGLVIYKHTPSASDIQDESASFPNKEVFILKNTKDNDVHSADFIPELEENKITCPRCRAMIARAQKLFKNITTIHRKGVLGICEHCRLKAQLPSVCTSCNEVVRKFLYDESQQKQHDKSKLHVKAWANAHQRLEDAIDENKEKTKDERAVFGLASKFQKERSKIIEIKPSYKPIPEEGPYESDVKIIKTESKNRGAINRSTIHSLSDLSILQVPDVNSLLQARLDGKLLDPKGIAIDTTLSMQTPDKPKPKLADSKDLSVKIQDKIEYAHLKFQSSMSDESLQYLKSFLDRNKHIQSEKKPRSSSLKSALSKAIPKSRNEASLESLAGDLMRSESFLSDDLSRVTADHVVKDNTYYFPPKEKKAKSFPVGNKSSSELIKDVREKIQTKAQEIKKKEQDELKIKDLEKQQKIEKLLEQSKILTREGKPLSMEEFDIILKQIEKKEAKKLSPNEIAKLIKKMYTSDGRLLHPNEIARIAKDILADEDIVSPDEIVKLIKQIHTKSGKLLPSVEIEKFLKEIRTTDGTFLDAVEVEKLLNLIRKNDGKPLTADDIENLIKQVHVNNLLLTEDVEKLLKQMHTQEGNLLPFDHIEKLVKQIRTKDGKHLTPEEVEEFVKQIRSKDGKTLSPSNLEKIMQQILSREDQTILPASEIDKLLNKINTKDGKQLPLGEIEKIVKQMQTKDGKPLSPEEVQLLVTKIQSKEGQPVLPDELNIFSKEIETKNEKVLAPGEIDKLLKQINSKVGKLLPPHEIEKLVKQMRTKDGKSLSPEEVQQLVKTIVSKEGKSISPDELEKLVKEVQQAKDKILQPGDFDKLLKQINNKDGKQLPFEEIDKLVKQMRTEDGKPLPPADVQQLVQKIKSKDGKPLSEGEVQQLIKQIQVKDGKRLTPEEPENILHTEKREPYSLKAPIKAPEQTKKVEGTEWKVAPDKETKSQKPFLKEAFSPKEPSTYVDKSVDTNEPKKKMEHAATSTAEKQTKEPGRSKKETDEVHKEGEFKTRDKDPGATTFLNKALAAQMKDKEKEEKLVKAQEEAQKKAKQAAAAAVSSKSLSSKDETRKGKEESVLIKNELTKDGTKDVTKEKKKKEQDGTSELNKALSAQAKEQEKQLKMKKQIEESLNKAKLAAAAAAKKELPAVTGKTTTPQTKVTESKGSPPPFEPEKLVLPKAPPPPLKELNIKDVTLLKPSDDDLILRLVRTRQTNAPPRPEEITPIKYRIQKSGYSAKSSRHLVKDDTSLQFDLESLERNKNVVKEYGDIVVGTKVLKNTPGVYVEEKEENVVPALFQSTFVGEPLLKKERKLEEIAIDGTAPAMDKNQPEPEPAKGIIRYSLSDRSFIEKGWTLLPTEKVVRKMNVYRMRPAHPEFDWFEHNKNKKFMTYDTGEKLAEFDDDGRGRVYYRNGRIALNYYDCEEANAQQRFVVFSNGEPDERGRGRPITVLGTFDYLGNGVVFDHSGKIRLKYNQTEGVILDRSLGPVSHWKWHSLNDPPVLQQVMIDTQLSHKDPEIKKLGSSFEDLTRPDNEEMLAIEFDNFIKEKSKKLSQKFKPFQIKMKAMKLNEHFSLRVLDQATIYLIYRDGTTNMKLNLGMLLDHQEIVDTDTAEMGEVSSNLERLPARTDSIAALQKGVMQAQRVERLRTDRDRRLRPTIPIASADRIAASSSKPLRPVITGTSASMTTPCKCRKPPAINIYYDTRLI